MRKLIVGIVCAAAGVAVHAQPPVPETYRCDFAPLLTLTGWVWVDHMTELYVNNCENELYTDPPDDLAAYFGEDAVSDAVAAAQAVVDVYRMKADWHRLGGAFEYIAAGQHHVQRGAVEAWSEGLYDDIVALVTTFSEHPDFLFPTNGQGWAVRSLFRAADNPATRLQTLSQYRQLVGDWRPGLANDTSYVQALTAATKLMGNARAHEGFAETVEALGDLPDVMAELAISVTDWIVLTSGFSYSFVVADVATELTRLLEYAQASFAPDVEEHVQNILDHPKILPVYDPSLFRNGIAPVTGAWRSDVPLRTYMNYAAVADAIERLGRCDDFYGVYGDGLNTPCDDRAFVTDELFPHEEGVSHRCTLDGGGVNVTVRTQTNGAFNQPNLIVTATAPSYYWVELDRAPDFKGKGCGLRRDSVPAAECTNWVRYYPDRPEYNYHVASQAEFDRLWERSRLAKLDRLCGVVADAEAGFGDVFGDDLDPVADDGNTVLEVVLFEDAYEYGAYVRWLFGGAAAAAASFVESDPSAAADAEGRTPPRVLVHPGSFSSGYVQALVAEDEVFWATTARVFDPPADAVELARESARYYDGRYNLHGRPDMEAAGLVWWDDGVAQHVKAGGRVHGDARELAMREKPMALRDILAATYDDRILRDHYQWAQLAVLYLTTEQPDSAEFILERTRAGDYEGAMRYVGLMGAAFDDDWAAWLADVVSAGRESTESAIDGEIDEDNLAEGWDRTADGGDAGEGGTDG